MKLKNILKIGLMLFCLLLCTNKIAYADMAIFPLAPLIDTMSGSLIILSLIAMLITITAELIIAKLMKIKHYRIILITNILTQLFLHINTINLFSIYTFKTQPIVIIFLEFIIWFTEYIIYSVTFSDCSKKKIFTYVMIANIITFATPYIVLWNTYNEKIILPYDDTFSIIHNNIFSIIDFIIPIIYVISIIVTITLNIKLKSLIDSNNKKESTSIKKILILSEVSTILLGITTLVFTFSDDSIGIIGFISQFITIIMIIEILLKEKE